MMNVIKKAAANITAVLSFFILTLSVIDLVNPSINMLDNLGARIILMVYCVFALACSVFYLCDFFINKVRKDRSEKE
ncbi:MAG: hypothetical protein E7665_09425 [Ruminococcaceae bacterium]|nr:hypothetical protein [Oscillospiraceae bacterium]